MSLAFRFVRSHLRTAPYPTLAPDCGQGRAALPKVSMALLAAVCAAGWLAAFPTSSRAVTIDGSPLSKVEAALLIEQLTNELSRTGSATEFLEKWCAGHRLAAEPRIRADLVEGERVPAIPVEGADLLDGGHHPLRYRHVKLFCGNRLLSDAQNWYRPDLLSAGMNATLDHTDVPFGRAVRDLNFTRRTIAIEGRWTPLPRDWESSAKLRQDPPMMLPRTIITQTAVLTSRAGDAFSYVLENYQDELLDFPLPRAAAPDEKN